MNPEKPKLKHQEKEQEQETAAAQEAQSREVEFQTPEEAIRHDAHSVTVPPSLPQRLGESIAQEPKPKGLRPWWRRWFGQ